MYSSMFQIDFYHEYQNPQVFWLLLLLLPAGVWYYFQHSKQHAHVKVSMEYELRYLPKSMMYYLLHIPFVLRMIVFIFLLFAFARPVSYDTYADTTTYGVDIVLAMDVSGSMLAQDLKPDRIEASKDVAAKFINSRPYDRIGLVVFSGESFTQCPLTTDHATLLNLLSEIRAGMVEDGTAIGMGIGVSINRLKESKAISKVIILLTDGVNNMGDIDPLTAAELASKFGIRIYTIGVGTRGKAPYPIQGIFGVQMQMIDVEIDEGVLRKIADITGGKYYRATNKQELVSIYESIDALEKTKIEDYKFTTKKEEYLPFVLWALVLFVLEFLIRKIVIKRFP